MSYIASEATRTVTGKDTIPTYDTLSSGTFTTSPTVSTALIYSGSLTAEDVFGADLQKAYKHNMYVYENTSTHGTLRRIVGVNGKGSEWGVQIESAFGTALASETAKIVTADLADYSVSNVGSVTGYYDGNELDAGVWVERREDTDRRGTRINRIAKAIDGTGTYLLVLENR